MDQTITLRAARTDETWDISALLLRSKAHWGYDDAFMAACVDVLTIAPDYLDEYQVIVAVDATDTLLGVCSVASDADIAKLDLLYIDPRAMGRGIGNILFEEAVTRAKDTGATRMIIDADPHAETFYQRMGAKTISKTPSEAIPGRMLPQLEYLL